MAAAKSPHPFFPSHDLLLLLNLFLLVASLLAGAVHGGSIATYWGQKQGEGTLGKACATRNYDYINIAYLTTFGSGQTPELHLPGHLNATHGCTCGIARDIKACQKRGVKVLLSLGGGGDGGRQSLNSTADAALVAEYLYNTFLGGRSPSGGRPFHGAVLDGVDFSVAGKAADQQGRTQYWDDLARALAGYSTRKRKVYLTAAPPCSAAGDRTLRRALATGLFDIAWVRFYDDASCEYAPEDGLLRVKMSWEEWNAKLRVGKVFFGMPASGEAAGEGYVSPGNFTRDVLPFIGDFPKYGGIALWDRYYDMMNSYSDEVKYDVKKSGPRKSSV